MLGNGYYIVEQNGKYGMIDNKEQIIVPIKYDYISPFKSGAALLYLANHFVGYASDKGHVTALTGESYTPVINKQFSNGYLLVKNDKGYFYINASNGTVIGPYANGMPFCEGYAMVRVPKSQKHILDGVSFPRCLSAATGSFVKLAFEEYDEEDIDFISSVNNDKCLIILKKRCYEYNVKSGECIPLSIDGTDNKKSRVYTENRQITPRQAKEGYAIDTKQGELLFDSLMRLTAIHYVGQDIIKYAMHEDPMPKVSSSLSAVSYPDQQLLGLAYKGKELLPAQFELVPKLSGNEAIIVSNNKYGIIGVDPRNKCQYMLNDNQDIAFEHKNTKCIVKVVCPASMQLPLISLESSDVLIHAETRKESSNVESAVLTYECTIDIPKNIGVEHSPATVSVSLNYDGLIYKPQNINYMAWYINNYIVDMEKSSVTNRTLDVDLLVRKTASNEPYFKDVSVTSADSVVCNISKLNEEMYNVQIYGWKDDQQQVKFNIHVKEDGCPSITYPFVVDIKDDKAVSKLKQPQHHKRKIKQDNNATKKEEKKKFIL